MNEIEVKVKVSDKKMIMKSLEDKGCKFSENIFQSDTIFLNNKNKEFKIVQGDKVIRIRKTLDNQILTLKQRKTIMNESKEIEFEVSDFYKVKEFLETLDYMEILNVTKNRIETSIRKI